MINLTNKEIAHLGILLQEEQDRLFLRLGSKNPKNPIIEKLFLKSEKLEKKLTEEFEKNIDE